MTTFTATEDRLARLAARKLDGARLHDFREVERDEREAAYIIRWENEHEHGTHRACISLTDEREMLIWGHYHRTRDDAVADFDQR